MLFRALTSPGLTLAECNHSSTKTYECSREGCLLKFCRRCLRVRYGPQTMQSARRGVGWECPRCEGRWYAAALELHMRWCVCGGTVLELGACVCR